MSILGKLFGNYTKRTTSPKPTLQGSLETIGLLETRKYKDAIVGLDNELREKPQNSNLWFLKGSALLQLGKHSEALTCLEKATSLAPNSAGGWAMKGEVLVELNRLDEAICAYRQFITLAPPEEAKYIAEVKHILEELEKIRKTTQDLRQPIDKEQTRAIMVRKAQILMEARKYEQAITFYDAALQILPCETKLVCGLLVMKSESCRKLRKWQDEMECWSKVIEIISSQSEPNSGLASESWINKAHALRMLKRDKEALVCYDKVLEMYPSAENVEFAKHSREQLLTRIKQVSDSSKTDLK